MQYITRFISVLLFAVMLPSDCGYRMKEEINDFLEPYPERDKKSWMASVRLQILNTYAEYALNTK